MYSRVRSAALNGIEAEEIFVESDISRGFPSFTIVGLPDAAIRESKERVRAAVVNSGFSFPDRRLFGHISPAIQRNGLICYLPLVRYSAHLSVRVVTGRVSVLLRVAALLVSELLISAL